jgi:hypothetical protein
MLTNFTHIRALIKSKTNLILADKMFLVTKLLFLLHFTSFFPYKSVTKQSIMKQSIMKVSIKKQSNINLLITKQTIMKPSI